MFRARWYLAAGLAGLGLALVLALAARSLPGRIETLLMSRIREQVVWLPDSPEPVAARFRGDVDPTQPPAHARFRFFNITNLAAVRLGSKPVLEEVGPYTFRMVRLKTDIQWVRGGAAVRWLEYRYHLWEPQLSNGTLEDPITTLNLPLVGVLESIASLPAWKVTWLLELLLGWVEQLGDPRVQGLFTTRTAGELLWGYDDLLLTKLAAWVPGINPRFHLARNMSSPEEARLDFPTQANTGLEGLQDVWQYQEWENVSAVTSWNPPHVEPVRGTDAFQFRPGLALNSTVDVWVGELYRAARLVVEEAVGLEGVPLLRLRADPSQGDPDPRFFQTIRGLMNVTAPTAAGPSGRVGKSGPPIFLSYPHYCDADPALTQGVEGLACNPQAHNLFVDIEPNTGITLRAAKRLMMSSWFGAKWRTIDPALRDTFLPIFWAELASQAKRAQLHQFWPLLRARAVQRVLRLNALPAAAAFTLVAVGCLCAAAVLWNESSSSEGETEAEAAAEAGTAAADGGNPAEQSSLLEPLLDSHPVAPSRPATAAAGEVVATSREVPSTGPPPACTLH